MSEEKLSCINYAVECLKDLYRNTSKEGFFYISAYDYYRNEWECELEAKTRFTKKEFRDSLIGISYDMYAIETIVNALHDETFNEDMLKENPILNDTYHRLLEPFDEPNFTEIMEKATILDWEDFTEEQYLCLEDQKAYEQDCVDRVGKGMGPDYYVTHSRRLFEMLKYGEPDIAVKYEIKCYVISYVLFHYGEAFTDFSDYQSPSLGLSPEEKEAFKAKELKEKKHNCHKIDKFTLEEKNAYIDQMAREMMSLFMK